MTGCVHCGLPLPGDRAEYCCVGCRIAAAVARPAGDGSGLSRQGLKLGFGLFIAVNLMAVSGVFYAADLFGEAAAARGSMTALTDLFAYLMLLLATLVVALLGLPLAEDAFARRPGPVPIDAQRLIVLGVVAAYGVSVWNTVRGDGRLYFDTAAMVLVLLIFGRWVEARARRRVAEGRASALDGLPQRAVVERDGETLEVAADEVVVGDLVRVRPGECAVVDGTVLRGRAHVDARTLTGESRPLPRAGGDELLAGSTALDGELWVVARRVGGSRTVAGIERLLDTARRHPPPIQRIADRFARVFTPLVTGIALLVLVIGVARGSFEEGLMRGLSVLLIACPCALGFAAPVAVAAAMRRAAERGIVFDSAAVVESTARLERIFFDKTGTLTTAAAEVLAVENVSRAKSDAEVLALLASLEAGFTHPLARGIAAHAREHGARPRPTERSRVLPGLGIEGWIEGRRYALGNRRLTGGEAPDGSELLLLEGDELLARIEVADRVRPEAASTLSTLQELRIRTAGLSGDSGEVAGKLGDRLGLPITGELLPADKVERVAAARREQVEGASVGMVGDGLNDAAVLAAADVGFVLSSATDLARQSGNVHLIDDRLDAVPDAVTLARHTYRRIALALSWAFAYNAVGVVLAVTGRLGPAFAASAMILSSLLVLALVGGAGGARPEHEGSGGEMWSASRVGPS